MATIGKIEVVLEKSIMASCVETRVQNSLIPQFTSELQFRAMSVRGRHAIELAAEKQSDY